jgi:hypothetical protein
VTGAVTGMPQPPCVEWCGANSSNSGEDVTPVCACCCLRCSDLERRHLQEKERARQEVAAKIRETKIAMAQLAGAAQPALPWWLTTGPCGALAAGCAHCCVSHVLLVLDHDNVYAA